MKNEKGFSLLELMVVIAIISVLLAGVGISMSYISSTNAKSAKSKVYNAIETARMISTAKAGGCYLQIKVQNGKYYYQIGTDVSGTQSVMIEDTEICSTRLPIVIDSKTIEEMTLNFDKASGALKSVNYHYNTVSGSTEVNIVGADITITIGNYVLKIHSLTGKVEVI